MAREQYMTVQELQEVKLENSVGQITEGCSKKFGFSSKCIGKSTVTYSITFKKDDPGEL